MGGSSSGLPTRMGMSMSSVSTARLKEDLGVNDLRVVTEQLRMQKLYGYVPAYGANLPDLSLAAEQVCWLLKDFPGYLWKIQIQDQVLTCVNETLHPDVGFNLLVKMLDNDGKVIRKFGAGLLDMFGQPEKLNADYILDAKKDLRGNLVRV